jgi:16S rRNA (guanine966-N2)-methyltransferase
VREALFSILGDLAGLRVADLFAGSGALGIEALSRGAASVCFVDSAAASVGCIQSNLRQLGVTDGASVVRGTVERSRARLLDAGPYDLVLCDPPWQRLGPLLDAISRVVAPPLLRQGGRVVIEHPARSQVLLEPQSSFPLVDRRAWGDTGAAFFLYSGAPGTD